MENEPVDLLGLRPVDDFLHEQTGDAATSPFRFREHVHDRALPAFANRHVIDRPWQDPLQLNAGPADNQFRLISRSRKPADIIAACEPFLETGPRFGAQNFKGVARNAAHVLKHP